MSLSAAFNIISSSFAANSAQTAVVSNNIANVNTPGYSRQIANLVTNSYGGADVVSVTREANAALAEQVSTSTAQAAAQQAIADGLATLAQTVSDSSSASTTSGADQNGASPSAMLANLQSALTTYETSPSSSSAADAAVTAAQNLASSLNSGSAAVANVREQADQDMASSVATINSLLSQFTAANNAVVTGLQAGTSVASAEDQRDSIVTQLSQQIGVSTITAANGSMSIYTDSGVTLFQDTPRAVSFTPTPTLVDGQSGSPVTVDGVPITGPNSPMPIQSGALAGYAALRDTLAPQYQAQLDQIAGGLINAFAESDQSTSPTLPSLPPAFSPRPAQRACPRRRRPRVSPRRSKSIRTPTLPKAATQPCCATGASPIRGNPAYTYNSTGAASYTGRLQQLVSAIGATQSFDPSAGLGRLRQSHRLHECVGQLAAGREQPGERRLDLSERARHSGDFRAVERDRRQSRRRDDQHAEPREFLRLVSEAAHDRQQHVLSAAERGMTMSANFVSSQFLANSLILPITQAQSALTTAMTEELTGQYADLGLQLGDQSGYELSLKEQVSLIQTFTSGNSLVSTNLATAQNALSAIGASAQTAMSALTVWTPSANSGATLQTTGQSALQALIASTNATSGDQYVFGGINSSVAPMADYYSTPDM